MAKRTELQKLNREPIMVTIGENKYPIYPKPIVEARVWKQKALPILKPFFDELQMLEEKNTSQVSEIKFATLFIKFATETIDELIELFFDYCTNLNKKEIESIATEEEIYDALFCVIELSFPLVKRLGINLRQLNLQNPSE